MRRKSIGGRLTVRLQETYGFTLTLVKGEDKRRFAHFAAGGAAFEAVPPNGAFGSDALPFEAKVAEMTFALKPLPPSDSAIFERFAAGLPAPSLPDPAFDGHIKAALRVWN